MPKCKQNACCQQCRRLAREMCCASDSCCCCIFALILELLAVTCAFAISQVTTSFGVRGQKSSVRDHTKLLAADMFRPVSRAWRQVPTASVVSVANGRGCGEATIGSSMGIYISGPWTKIRYTTTLAGRTSCYSMFGNERFNNHVHTGMTILPCNAWQRAYTTVRARRQRDIPLH